jgi:hypothetical protein
MGSFDSDSQNLFTSIVVVHADSNNSRFWKARKGTGLSLQQTPFKIQRIVEVF